MPLYIQRTFFAVLALCLMGALGCYTTVPLSSEPPRPDREVVLEFTDAGAQRLGGLLGGAVVSARGKPVQWTPDTVALAMVATATSLGREQFWHGERVTIPREVIARIRERRLDSRRTALAVAGGIAVIALVEGIRGANRGAPPILEPTPPPTRSWRRP